MAQGLIRYRCFLPDLTEFTVPPCTGPNYQQSTSHKRVNSRATQSEPRRLSRRSVISDRRNGGEGGIRTLGTLIRGTHDFQFSSYSTFNRLFAIPSSEILLPLPCRLFVFGYRCLSDLYKSCTATDFSFQRKILHYV